MVLGVVCPEFRQIEKRYETLKPFSPTLKLFDQYDIARIEPKVVERRGEEILALGSTDEYTAVNFGELSRSFIRQARLEADKHTDRFIDVYYNEEVEEIKQLVQTIIPTAMEFSVPLKVDIKTGRNWGETE